MSDTTSTPPAVDQVPPTDPAKAARIERLREANRKYREKRRAERSTAASDPTAPAAPSKPARRRGRPPKPKPPKGPSKAEAILAVKIRRLISDDLSRYRPGDRVGRWIGGPNELADISKRPGFAAGWAGALLDALQSATAVSRYDELLRAILPGLGSQFGLAMSPGALGIMAQLPEAVTLWRVAGPKNKVGFVWCSSREAAIAYAKCPAIRTREPLLIEAVVDRDRILAVWETPFGFEGLALSEAGDIVSEVQIR